MIEVHGLWILEEKGDVPASSSSSSSSSSSPLNASRDKKVKKVKKAKKWRRRNPLRDVALGEGLSSDSEGDVNPVESSSSEDEGKSGGGRVDNLSDGEEEEGPHVGKKREAIEEIGMLLELNMLELLLTCDEERHATWQLVNTTDRRFINPFPSVTEYQIDDGGFYLTNEERSEFVRLEPALDAQGHLSLAREDGGILILQKVRTTVRLFFLRTTNIFSFVSFISCSSFFLFLFSFFLVIS